MSALPTERSKQELRAAALAKRDALSDKQRAKSAQALARRGLPLEITRVSEATVGMTSINPAGASTATFAEVLDGPAYFDYERTSLGYNLFGTAATACQLTLATGEVFRLGKTTVTRIF